MIRKDEIVESVIADYYNLGLKRNKSLFVEFLPKGYTQVTLNTVPELYNKDLINIKTLLGIFITLYDDFVDNPQYANPKLIHELIKIPFNKAYIDKKELTNFELAIFAFAESIFIHIITYLEYLPNFKLIKPLLYFDIEQFFNGLKYAQLIRGLPQIANEIEYLCYLPHNMGIILIGMMDLMAIADLNVNEIGLIREFLWLAQRFSNICNTLTTLERELAEDDVGNEIMLLATKKHQQVHITSIEQAKEKLINERLAIIKQLSLFKAQSFSTADYIKGLEYLQCLHQSMQGLI